MSTEEDDPLKELVTRMKSATSPLRGLLRELHEQLSLVNDGAVANYIPELALSKPEWFGISVFGINGESVEFGDVKQEFTIQSVSKPFVFGQALEDKGREAVLGKVGVQPTNEAFNSITLDEKTNRPFNPMVNAGAIATADLIDGKDFPDRIKRLTRMFNTYAGRELTIDNSVYTSERATGHRNRAMGHLMLNFGMMRDRVEETLDLYFMQCSVRVTCHDLAVMGATLANKGVNPLTQQRAISAEHVKDVLSVMLTCGMYDYAGEWAYRVGIPAKSGVGGGIVGVIPGVGGIATFSPLLDPKGNSIRGIKTFEALSEKFKLHLLACDISDESLAQILKGLRN